ncbi:MAG TPA: DUF4130 domain-containing protein [Methanomicrobia archaeon]|nr:DUF4130 domain-containing protein [Methanomicrobia archaeon]
MNMPNNFLDYLSCHKNATPALMNHARKKTSYEIELASTRIDAKIRAMVSSVRLELHRMSGFVRLTPLSDVVLHGHLRPHHAVGQMVCDRLARRYPHTIVVLGNPHVTWISLYTDRGLFKCRGDSLQSTVRFFEERLGDSTDTSVSSLWSVYYDSQFRPKRRNLELFRKSIPKKAEKSASMNVERSHETATLDGFMT